MPGGASPQQAYLTDVSCPALGTCSATGYYNGSGDSLVIPVTGGVPGQASSVTTPDGRPASLDAISCQSSTSCFAVGTYQDQSSDTEPLVVAISDGVPAAGIEPSLPSDAEGSGQDGELYGLGCPASGSCLATGYYVNTAGYTMPLIASLSTASDDVAVSPALPVGASPGTGTWLGVYDTAACGMSSCVAAGGYNNSGGNDVPLVLSVQSQLAVSTTTLAGGAVGTPYSQTLSATGAWGVYSWAVTSGGLPAGLSLNAQTGVISGTPTAGGTSTFTVTATGTGLPAQTATQSYSVAITAASVSTPPTPVSTPAAVPKLALISHSATVSKNKFSLKLSCSAASCHGSLKLRISETVTVKRGKKRVRKHELVAIGNAGFSLLAGQTKSIKVTINAVGRRALTARHHLTATVLDTLGGAKGTLGRVTLKPAPVKHKKKH